MFWPYCVGQMPAPTVLVGSDAQAKQASNYVRLMGAEEGGKGAFSNGLKELSAWSPLEYSYRRRFSSCI